MTVKSQTSGGPAPTMGYSDMGKNS